MLSHCNLRIGQFRAASWCKLPIVWDAVGEDYDWVIFADSDAVIREPDVGVDAFISRNMAAEVKKRTRKSFFRSLDSKENVTVGGLVSGPPLDKASLIFLADWPYSSLPCAGFFLARGGKQTQDVIRRWWDSNDEQHNVRHACVVWSWCAATWHLSVHYRLPLQVRAGFPVVSLALFITTYY